MAYERVKPTYICIYFSGYLFDEGPFIRWVSEAFFGVLIGEYQISSVSIFRVTTVFTSHVGRLKLLSKMNSAVAYG